MNRYTRTAGSTQASRRFNLEIIQAGDNCPFTRVKAILPIEFLETSGSQPTIEEYVITPSDAAQRQTIGNQTLIAKSDSKAVELHNKLKELANLSAGWNSYDAPPPNSLALSRARLVLEVLLSQNVEPVNVLPSVEGGAGFVFRKGDKHGDIECLNCGTIVAVFYSRQVKPQSWVVAPTTESITDAINRINLFLNA